MQSTLVGTHGEKDTKSLFPWSLYTSERGQAQRAMGTEADGRKCRQRSKVGSRTQNAWVDSVDRQRGPFPATACRLRPE